MSPPQNSLHNSETSVSYSQRSQGSLRERTSWHQRRQRHVPAGDDDLDDIAVETDVLYPQYGYPNDNTDRMNSSNLEAFDDGIAELKRRQSNGSVLSRSMNRKSRLYGEKTQVCLDSDGLVPQTVRYHVFSSQETSSTMPILELLSVDGRQGLEVILETTGWWVDCLCPTDEEMHVLAKLFRIHPLTVEDISAKEPVEKIELFQNYTFVSFRSFDVNNETNQIRPYTFYNLIFKNGLLTFHFVPSRHPAHVRHRLDRMKNHMLIVPDWIHYALIDDITDAFAPFISQVEVEVVSIDELVFLLHKSERFDMLKRISRGRKRTSQLSRLLTTKADVVKGLMKRYEEKWQRAGGYGALMVDEFSTTTPEELVALKTLNEVLLYLGDIQDHLVTMIQNLNHYNRMLSRAHTNYLAQVNVDLSKTYRLTNAVMNRLTFLGTVFIPIIYVSALWGMNVLVPGQNDLDTTWFYWIIIGMVAYCISVTYFGKKWGVL